jgi:hypothetical protein
MAIWSGLRHEVVGKERHDVCNVDEGAPRLRQPRIAKPMTAALDPKSLRGRIPQGTQCQIKKAVLAAVVAAGTVLAVPLLDMRQSHIAPDNCTSRPLPNRNARPTKSASSTIAVTATGTGVDEAARLTVLHRLVEPTDSRSGLW